MKNGLAAQALHAAKPSKDSGILYVSSPRSGRAPLCIPYFLGPEGLGCFCSPESFHIFSVEKASPGRAWLWDWDQLGTHHKSQLPPEES